MHQKRPRAAHADVPGSSLSAVLTVQRPTTTACAGTAPVAHVFATGGPEVLVQGAVVQPGGVVHLLGIGFPPCAPVAVGETPPAADVQPPRLTGVSTDRFGDFRVAVPIPASYKACSIFLATAVNGVAGPLVDVAISHPSGSCPSYG